MQGCKATMRNNTVSAFDLTVQGLGCQTEIPNEDAALSVALKVSSRFVLAVQLTRGCSFPILNIHYTRITMWCDKRMLILNLKHTLIKNNRTSGIREEVGRKSYRKKTLYTPVFGLHDFQTLDKILF